MILFLTYILNIGLGILIAVFALKFTYTQNPVIIIAMGAIIAELTAVITVIAYKLQEIKKNGKKNA